MIVNGIIKAPITMSDIGKVIGSNSRSIGELIKDGYINMWSRMKPVHIENGWAPNRSGAWWRGTDLDCGISLVDAKTSNYKLIKDKYTEDKSNGWKYKKPWGDLGGIVVSPYRMLDFQNYKHDATPPIGGFGITELVAQDGILRAQCMLTPTTTDKTGPGSVQFDDIAGDYSSGDSGSTTLADYHLGVAVYDSANTYKGRVVGGNAFDKLATEYSVAGLAFGQTYKAVPFLAKFQMGQFQTDIANFYYTVPNANVMTFKIASAEEIEGISINLTAKYIYNAARVRISISWELTVESTKTGNSFTNNRVAMRFNRNQPLDPIQSGERQNILTDFDASPGNSFITSGLFSIGSQYADEDYYIYLSLSTAKYTRKIPPMQEVIP